MKIHSKLILAGVLALAVLFSFALLGAQAQASSEAVATLSAERVSFAADQAVRLQVTLTNPTNHTIKVLKWYTPASGVEEPLFTVTRDGQAVSYTGALYKRPPATSKDYLVLKAGESRTYTVVLDGVYDLSKTGSYTVSYQVTSPYLSSEKGSAGKRPEILASNQVTIEVSGRGSKKPTDPLVCDDDNYNCFSRCTTEQQGIAAAARGQASVYSADALGYLTLSTVGPRYTTWFGVYNPGYYGTVTTHFTAISGAMDDATVTFDCGCKQPYFAYVYPDQPYKIYLCKVFWTVSLTGTDSQAGTLIHEMSHFTVVASTDDYVYGQTLAKELAISDPALAINNADNHEYFAENTPFLP